MKKTIFKRVTSALIGAVVASGSMMIPSSIPASFAASELEKSLANDSGLDIDFARALQYSIYFYDANMCGTGVSENNRYAWRGDCHTYDAQVPLKPMEDNVGTNLSQSFIDKYASVLDPDGDGYVDVAGGFHDAGDHVKFGMPENYAASTVGWGYYEFRDAYVKTGQDDHVETILRYFNDYLMKCTFLDDNGEVVAHCYQVGDGDIDHAYWNSPEVDKMARPAFFLTGDKPQTDYVASAAASLAINYLNFKDTDEEYAELDTNFKKMYTNFVSKGTPVIIGEYGVLTEAKNGKDADSITKYLKAVSETAVKYGMCPVLWDASVGGDMNFIDRNSLQFNSSDIENMYKDVAARIESGELKKDDNIKGNDTYKEIEVSLTDGVSVDVSKYDKKPVGAKIYLSCSTDWDSYGGGAVHYDDGSSDWVYQEYGFNSVYDVIEMKFNDKVMSSMNNGTAKQLDFFIWWTALDNEADENSGHASELSFKDNKVVLLFENDEQPEETTVTTAETTVSETPVETTETTKETAEETSETTASESSSESVSSSGSGLEAALKGDATCDGEVDVRDVTLVNQYYVKMSDITEQGLANADVISDGIVDLKDLGQLKKYLIKVVDSL